MEVKPFSVQSPTSIAQEYGGNKQKIAQAASMGVLDPTAAVLAGMFIDRMRSASQAEQAPSTTIAQQVFAPPAPPQQAAPPPQAGLGALAPGAPPMGPGMPGAPQMGPGAPPMGPGGPPQGMAMGGLYEQGSGLSELPIPDTMFDEPRNGSYAGGGLVALAAGGPATPELDAYGRPLTMAGALEATNQLYGEQPHQYLDMQEEYYKKRMDPAVLKREKKDDLWGALAQIGFGMAGSNSPYFLQAAGQAASAALPGIIAKKDQRKVEEKQNIDGLAGIEGQRYDRKGRRIESALTMQGQAISAAEAEKVRKNQMEQQRLQSGATIRAAEINAGASNYAADKRAGAEKDYFTAMQNATLNLKIEEAVEKDVNNPFGPNEYKVLERLDRKGGNSAVYKGKKVIPGNLAEEYKEGLRAKYRRLMGVPAPTGGELPVSPGRSGFEGWGKPRIVG